MFLKIVSATILLLPAVFAQLSDRATWAAQAVNNYQVTPNITYLTANNYEAKLDVYQRRNTSSPQPTLIYIHGGGWTGGTKESVLMEIMPWFEMGWTDRIARLTRSRG